jgi:hypothetical protein
LLYIRDVLSEPAQLSAREDFNGFYVEVAADPAPGAVTRLDALAGWHQMQRSKAQESTGNVAWGGSSPTAARTDARGFYLHPGRAGISPRNQTKKYWDPFDV